MIKNIIKNKIILASGIVLALFSSCKDESKDPHFVELDDNNSAPYVRLVSSTSLFDISKISEESYTGTLSAPANNVESWSVSVYRISGGISSDTIPLQTITSFPSDIEITTTEIADALDISIDDFSAGDSVNFLGTSIGTNDVVLTIDELSGPVSGQAEQNQSYDFGVTIGCPETDEPIPVVAGEWTIQMYDAYGDGWQPTTADGGGPGITVTLSNGTVYEIGMCTVWETPGYDCTPGDGFEATQVITIPEGLTSDDWEWVLNGDNWGEMSFEIYSPNGLQVGKRSAAGLAEPQVIDLLMCAQ